MLRTHLLGHAPSLPPDGRIEVAIARRSYELNLRPPAPDGMRYLIAGRPAPWLVADDVVEPGREIAVALELLPPDDAFYTFKGHLGACRRLAGRDGPPGAQHSTMPALLP
jgi:hypothetical protein